MAGKAKRSLRASPEGISRANRAVLRYATRIDFAAELEISRTTVQNFFAGKPIGRENFHKICQHLGLPWEEIAELPKVPETKQPERDRADAEIERLVEQLRRQRYPCVQHQCGTMRVLDMSQPIKISGIYTDVNVLENISRRRRLGIDELCQALVTQQRDRPDLSQGRQERISGQEAVRRYSKLMVWGKPGAGKTTFLKYIALECNQGRLQAERVPVFINLRDCAEAESKPNLIDCIRGQLSSETQVIEKLLCHGRLLLLLDGLDEVKAADSKRVCLDIDRFAARFPRNHFIITCRLAAQEFAFEQFTEVEIADFDDEQISTFAQRWFADKNSAQGAKLIQKLQDNGSIRELATNPLLLTLLCLVFEQSNDFPLNRCDLYQEGLDILLRKWDAKRYIEREQAYQDLSLPHKEALLSRIALATFKRGDYFFEQREIEQHITDYFRTLPDANTNSQAMHLDSEAVLKSIEAQHGLLVERAKGVYSFSHLTFHEYFAARALAANTDPHVLDEAIAQVLHQQADKHWREVFPLIVEMSPNACGFLHQIKHHLDRLVAADPDLQKLVEWLNQQAQAAHIPYKRVAVRAFYLDLLCTFLQKLTLSQLLALVLKLDPARILDLDGDPGLTFDFATALNLEPNLSLNLDLAMAFGYNLAYKLDPRILFDPCLEFPLAEGVLVDQQRQSAFEELRLQLPDPTQDEVQLWQWWQRQGLSWTKRVKALESQYRSLKPFWQLTPEQLAGLKRFYQANQLLVDCLTKDDCLSSEVRAEIETSLLLPVTGMIPSDRVIDMFSANYLNYLFK